MRLRLAAAVAVLALGVGCAEATEVDALKQEVERLDSRVSELEVYLEEVGAGVEDHEDRLLYLEDPDL